MFGIDPALESGVQISVLNCFNLWCGRTQMEKIANASNQKERRQHPRVRVEWPVVIQRKDRASAGVATNISSEGALIRTDRPPLPKEKLQLFVLAPEREAIRIKSAVSWSQVDFCQNDFYPSGVGIRFTGLSRSDREFLMSWIKSQLATRTDQSLLSVRTPKLALTFRSIEGT
jgi:hypothetical protein